MLQLLPSSISHQIPHGRNLDFGLISGSWPPGRNWRVFQKPYGEKWIAYLIFGKEPRIFGNHWGFRRAHDSWSQKVSQRMEAAEMCDHFCDGSRGMDDFNYFCWVEVQWKFQKIASFLGCFVGTPNSCQNFDNSLRWKPKNRLESQTFQLSLRIFFPIQKMVTTWCFSGPTIGWVVILIFCVMFQETPFFLDMILITRVCLSIPSPMKDLCGNGFMVWKSAKVSWVEHLATTRTRREDLGHPTFFRWVLGASGGMLQNWCERNMACVNV